MSRKRIPFNIAAGGTFVLIAGLMLFMLVLAPVNATNTSDLAKVKTYVAAYISGQFGAGGTEGEDGFVISAATLDTRINSNGDANILGEGDDAATAPVLNDNLGTQTTWIPGTATRCQWNAGTGLTGASANCFDSGKVTEVKARVDAHAAAGFSTDIVDYCVSGHTEASTTGGWGYLAQAPNALGTGITPKVYALKWGRQGWTNGSTATFTNTLTIGAADAAGVQTPPTSVAAASACDSTVSDAELMRCQVQWAIYNGTVGGMTGGNVGNGVSQAQMLAGNIDTWQTVDIRTGTPDTVSTGASNIRVPIDTIFGSGLTSIDPAANTVVVSRTPMVGGIVAEGLKMLGYNLTVVSGTSGGMLNGGIRGWNNTVGEAPVSDGLTRAALTSTPIDTTAPGITVAPSATVIGPTSATIGRTADEPASMKVEYGTTSGVYTTTVNNTVLNAVKTVDLTGLTPATPYYVRVTSYDGQANGTVSSEFSFTTSSTPGPNDRYYYLPWYDSTASWGMRAWITIANMSDHAINGVEVNVGGVTKATENIPSGGHLELKYDDVNSGPAYVRIPNGITSGDKLTVSERTLYQNSFNENLAYDKANSGSSFAFTWYDNNASWGMMGDWIGIINVDTTDATVDVFINDLVTPAITKVVAPGAVEIFQMPTTVTNGPVKVVAQGGKQIITSQRVLFESSFNEVMGDKLA